MALVSIGIVFSYVELIVWITAFLNPFVFILELILVYKYFQWMFRAVSNWLLQKQIKKVSIFLEEENKRFYSRKLIKWRLDEEGSKVVMANLRW